MRIVFDENTPPVVARAIALLAHADAGGQPREVLHALEVVGRGTPDVPLIEAVVHGAVGPAALITADKSMRTRRHEHRAFQETGCIGIILMGGWNHASMWDRARMTMIWWQLWVQTIAAAEPGSLWQSPWSQRPKSLRRR